MIDKTTILQIFGSLLLHPQFLSQTDKYNLTPDDFKHRLDKYIFIAIDSLYRDGVTRINPIDVENYLSTNEQAKLLFSRQKGVEYLQDAEYMADESSFPYYYKKLKKVNLLNVLSDKGIDVSDFYVKEPLTDQELEINSKFEDLEISEILGHIKSKLLGIERSFIEKDTTQTQKAFTGIKNILEAAEIQADIGKPVQGEIFNEVMSGARSGTLAVRSAPSGVGKALPNSIKIPTPLGWREVGEVRVGDYLFDALGKPTKVTGVFPQGKKEVWEAHFKDGRKAKSSPDHLWSYNTRGQRQKSKDERKFFTKTLKDIAAEGLMSGLGYRVLVPQHHAVEYGEKKLPIPPYVLGLAIGDGSFRQQDSNKSFQFSSETDELPRVIADTMGYTLKKGSEHNYTWYFGSQKQLGSRKKNIWVEDFLRELPELINTTSANKYIPEMYLYSSTEQRLDLLNGLLDSDGTVDEKGRVDFFTNSSKLRDNVTELASSLGYFVTVSEDNRKENINYIIRITGTPELKNKLFKLARKRKRMEDWYNNGNRKERNTHNPIVDIVNLGYEEDMTCFMVDNEEHLFLTEDFIVTHNTRQAVGDACYLAFPLRYDIKEKEWVYEGSNEKVLIIVTEQSIKEVQRMVLSYLTGMNETRFRFGDFTSQEKDIIAQALWVMDQYQDNFFIVQMPNPTIELIKTITRENVLLYDIDAVFYDYIFIGPAVLGEFSGFNLRNDEVLLMMATALKDLAVELDIFVMTSTQVNANADKDENIRNESSIAGSRAVINKADIGVIAARPTKEDINFFKANDEFELSPNLVTDVYKVRSGQWTQVRIWSDIDLGNLRKCDLFATDSHYDVIPDIGYPCVFVADWESEEYLTIEKQIKELKEVKFES